jgi:hypothetical protein
LAIETEKLFDATVVDMHVSINYLPNGMDLLPTIFSHVEAMRISLWDTAFFREFGVDKGVHKTTTLTSNILVFRPCEGCFIGTSNMFCFLLKSFPNSPLSLLTIWTLKVKSAY